METSTIALITSLLVTATEEREVGAVVIEITAAFDASTNTVAAALASCRSLVTSRVKKYVA